MPKPNPTVDVWAPQLDACVEESAPCKAASALDVQLRKVSPSVRFSFLLRLLEHPSRRVARYALYRLYPFRGRAEIVPHLERILETSSDPALLKMAAALALVSGSSQAAAAFMRHYDRLGSDVRNAVAWAIRAQYTQLDVAFLEKLREDSSPLVRTAAMEIQSVRAGALDDLVQCLRALGPGAAGCAVSFARVGHPDAARALVGVWEEFLQAASSARRRLAVPAEAVSSVELLYGQKRMDAAVAGDLLERILSARGLEDAVRAQAALSLGRVRGPAALPVLRRFRKDPRRAVAYAARRAVYLTERDAATP